MWSAVRLYSETSGNSKAMAAKNAHPTMATVAISLSRRGSTRIVDADTVLPSLGNSLPALLNDTPRAQMCLYQGPIHRSAWNSYSRKFAVASSAGPVGAYGPGRGKAYSGPVLAPRLATHVARIRYERLRLATA